MSPFSSEPSRIMKSSNLTILCPVSAPRFSFQPVSADSLMPASVTRSPSVKIRTFILVSIGSVSDSLALLRALCFRNSKIYHRMGCWSWEFSKWKKSSSFTYEISFVKLHRWECGQITLMGMRSNYINGNVVKLH
jgi:hypothetical protein